MTRPQLLRPVLLFDAATCLIMGVLLIGAGGFVATATELPAALLAGAGIVLLPFSLFVLWAARVGGGWPVQFVIAANIAWVLASFGAIVWAQPNGLGVVLVVVQAIAVGAIAGLQAHALPRNNSGMA
jgi:hypothetical protein